MSLEQTLNNLSQQIGDDVKSLKKIVIPVGGIFRGINGEISGWKDDGIFTDNVSSLGNVGGSLSRYAGGICFPFNVKLTRFFCWHFNGGAEVSPWGWVIARQEKIDSGRNEFSTFILDESFDRGDGQLNLRDYGDNQTYKTDINSFVNSSIPAGEVVFLGIGSPVVTTANKHVKIMSGFLEFERLDF